MTEQLARGAQSREELLQKEFSGEQNVLKSRIESLQQTVKEQQQQIAGLAAQLEKSYTQVQDIALKAIEGSSNVKGYAFAAQSLSPEPTRRAARGEE